MRFFFLSLLFYYFIITWRSKVIFLAGIFYDSSSHKKLEKRAPGRYVYRATFGPGPRIMVWNGRADGPEDG